jgi:molybdopterin-biosynthesis enzyme MoeA-like protein
VPTSLDADEIGPTHSDITADCVAKAFGVPINTDPRALAILHEWVKATGAEMNKARLRLTRIPKGAARDAQKLAQAKREIEEMLERVRRAQSNSP